MAHGETKQNIGLQHTMFIKTSTLTAIWRWEHNHKQTFSRCAYLKSQSQKCKKTCRQPHGGPQVRRL